MQPGKCSLGKGTVYWKLMSLKCPRSSDDGCWWLVLTFCASGDPVVQVSSNKSDDADKAMAVGCRTEES